MIDPEPQHPDHKQRPLRVALAHDWLVAFRGGEMVLDAIARLLIEHNHTITRIYTMFDNGAPLSPTLDTIPRTASSLNKLPESLRRWLLPRYPAAVNELSKRIHRDNARVPIDLLISTSSAAVKGIKPPPGVPHLCYCHSPARYLWSQTNQYRSKDPKGRLRTIGLNAFAPTLRRWDRRTAQTVSRFIANSEHTANEINRCYQRHAAVVHPPVRTEYFTPDPATTRKNHLLIVSALEPYKRIDLAIDAARRTRTPLVIIGRGSHENALRAKAAGNKLITFTGWAPDSTVRQHYRSARAFLFPQIEDFGITAVEAQACGCPVIARRAGGALDTVIQNQTGQLFDEPTPQAIAEAIRKCPHPDDCAQACRENALRFSTERFNQQMLDHIRTATARE